jgi:hypothetical protein
MQNVNVAAQTPELMSDVELSRYLGVSVACLRKWRIRRVGVPWIKLGTTLVRYRMTDVQAYLDSCPKGGGGSAVA